MRYYFVFILLAFSIINSTFAQHEFVQAQKKEAYLLQRVLTLNHFSPHKIDDNFSRLVFRRMLMALDPREVYFSEADIKELSSVRNSIDNDLLGESWSFLPKLSTLYKKRVEESELILTTLLKAPLTFNEKDRLYISEVDTLNYIRSDIEKKQRWEKWIKFEVLWHMTSQYNSSKSDSAKLIKTGVVSQAEIQDKVFKIEKKNISKLLNPVGGFDLKLRSLYYYIITSSFDPHTNFMSPEDWSGFNASISTEVMSFGMELEENELGEVSIARLIPGGAAWKSNELHKGDCIVQLKWEDKDFIDVTSLDVEGIEEILNQSNTLKLEFTIRKVNGLTKKISLVKEKIKEEENSVKSFILNGDRKIGYISLPGFYTEWEEGGKGCANDVASEIIKLKKENVEGLILDIRYNGGGSVYEGLNLAGLFIDEGPLFMFKSNDQKITIVRDMNRGTVYDGPLLVMINGQSASASELLASTLQDYNRAVIVGSTSYGKATGQKIVPLDTTTYGIALNEENIKMGVLKVTVQKLYRVTGQSAQLKGVQPDVVIPDLSIDDYYEKDSPYALPYDTATKKAMIKSYIPLPISSLISRSKERIMKHSGFQKMELLAKKMPESWYFPKDGIPLSFDAFQKKYLAHQDWNLSMEQAEENVSNLFSIENHSFDKELMKIDAYNNETNKIILENLKKDIHIEESFLIMNDLITIIKP